MTHDHQGDRGSVSVTRVSATRMRVGLLCLALGACASARERSGDGGPFGQADDPSAQGSGCPGANCAGGDGDRDGGAGQGSDDCSDCAPTPQCDDAGCTSKCGDGLVLGEACDDGNNRDGDGCSHDCKPEPGFTCALGSNCGDGGVPCTLRVPVTYRDFQPHQPQDFEVGCGDLTKGVVEDRLSAQGKPVLKNGGPACIQSAATFAEWYTKSADNREIQDELTLYQTDAGAYVNRYGPRGQQWTDPQGKTYDGNPLFFPIDDAPEAFQDQRYPAKIPEQYGYPGWPWESTLHPDQPEPLHNFSFTTEVVSWFLYDETKSATLEFTGDDDVWVFINGTLAVDLGGCHVPESGSVTVDRDSAAQFGLEHGKFYQIHVFHAERKQQGSSFRLTLSGLDMQRSECRPDCGDGKVELGEDCDDGNRKDGDSCPANCLAPLL
jgi:fibro-slime domain-containing protein